MGAASSFQKAFCGKVEQNEYTQVHAFNSQVVGNGIGGSVLVRELVTAKVIEKTYRFTGLSYGDAHTTTAQNVTDVAGNSYSVPMKSEIRDGSTGSAFCEVYSCDVRRTQISPRLWDVTVRTREIEYYVNGEKII